MSGASVIFDDPDAGPIELRVVSQREVLGFWGLVAGIDLERALKVLPEVELGVEAEGWGTEDVRALIEVLGLCSMAVLSPAPRFAPDELPRPFPGGLIRPDATWTHEVLQRIDVRVLELAGISE